MRLGLTLLLVALSLPAVAMAATDAALSSELQAAVAAATRRDDSAAALAHLARLEAAHPRDYEGKQYDYLRADLATRVGDEALARKSLRQLITTRSPLADRASVRLARLLAASQPTAALALVHGFGKRFPTSAVARDARILEVVLQARAGRPRTAEALRLRLPKGYRRDADRELLEFWATHDPPRATTRALQILAQSTGDAAAFAAAHVLVARGTAKLRDRDRWVVANTLYAQRAFGAATAELDWLGDHARLPAMRADALFLRGRVAMKLGDEPAARAAFHQLLSRGGAIGERALYQLGRLAQHCGDEFEAIERFRELAWTGLPARGYAAEAALKLIRIHAGAGRIAEAREFLALLDRRTARSSDSAASGAVQVAGALCRLGQPGEALAVLADRRPRDRARRRELAYWRGVALEASGRAADAAVALRLLAEGTDLLARLARERGGRLAVEPPAKLVALIDEAERRLATADPGGARLLAMQALGAGAAGSLAARADAIQCRAGRLLPLASVTAARAGSRPGKGRNRQVAWILSELGLDAEAAAELERVPGKEAQELYDLARLAFAAGHFKASVRFGDALRGRLGLNQRDECLPDPVFDLIYPRPYHDLIEEAARAERVDPDLVRSIMREESRFDPNAHSPAGARGLMQFIPETAVEVAASIGMKLTSPELVYQPQLAIPLGAAYLGRLVRLFEGSESAAVAAYNAGEEASFEWLHRTRRGELDGFLHAIEYDETRAYVDRVLTTLAAYRGRRAAASPKPE